MRDTKITITAGRKKKELRILFFCFLLANGINIYSIIKYDTNWIELIRMIPFELAITLAIYAFLFVLRCIVNIFIKKVNH